MYVQGFVTPVKAGDKQAYKEVAEQFWPVLQDCGATEHVECWEADVPDGKQTDFRKAVALDDGEKVVFSWLVWPDKATADAGHDKMMADERMKAMDMANMPFDGKRMIHGGFTPFVGGPTGAWGASGYVTGYVIPVPEGSKDKYRQLSEIYWDHARQHGAIEQVETWETDVPDGKVTDFHRAVQVTDAEKVVFAWMVWPDQATAKAFQQQDFDLLSNDPRMKAIGEDMPFDGKRMIFGGFEPIVHEEAK
ncbi:MAG: DUF1428 family protein [Acetobacteraceae bacterium]|nr:DUF1428 family protein [Acetobacteraceae bacterium]